MSIRCVQNFQKKKKISPKDCEKNIKKTFVYFPTGIKNDEKKKKIYSPGCESVHVFSLGGGDT